MALDRFIHFEKGKVPSKEDLGKALEDFLGTFAEEVVWDRDRWFAHLVGTKSWPFRRLEPADSIGAIAAAEEASEERWIEVWLDNESVDVLTRHGDWATNTLAEGFAKLVAQYWKGRLEEE